MFEDEVEELMCDYGLSPMDARSIAKELRATKYALWMARALRDEDKAYNATEEILRYRAENPNTKLYPSTPFMPAEIAEWKRRWQWAERKCLAKAREFE